MRSQVLFTEQELSNKVGEIAYKISKKANRIITNILWAVIFKISNLLKSYRK